MTSEQLRAIHKARPFKSFTLHMADGTSVAVRRPEVFMLTQGGGTILVNTSGDKIVIIDLSLIVKITRNNDSTRARRKNSR